MKEQQIKEYSRRAAKNAIKKGFEDNEAPISHVLMKAVCEVAEMIDARRDGRVGDLIGFRAVYSNAGQEDFYVAFRDRCEGTIQVEMADVAIFILDAIEYFDICPTQAEIDEYTRKYVKVPTNFIDAAYELTSMLVDRRFERDNAALVLSYLDVWLNRDFDEELFDWVELKMRYNESRPMLHGHRGNAAL